MNEPMGRESKRGNKHEGRLLAGRGGSKDSQSGINAPARALVANVGSAWARCLGEGRKNRRVDLKASYLRRMGLG